MPADTKAKPETWLDWMPEGAPEPDLLSRDELLEALRIERGIELTPASFHHYRKIGLLPRPIRRRHEGVTQAVYPDWFIGAIAHLKHLQERGRTLEQIKPHMRVWALSGIRWQDPLKQDLANLDAALRDYAKRYMEKTDLGGRNINMIRVTFFDDDGEEIDHHDTGQT